ncbi:MAG: chromate efflux transporter [Azonexus sp.]|nr:chromate efflux transporter [Azonexus sp.]
MNELTKAMEHELEPGSSAIRQHWNGVVEVFAAFLKLGLTSFGGPVAHLAYFRSEFVGCRQWLDDARYADLVALCQFLPGPASSQVGIALGWQRAGWLGALAAWLGFTLPSAIALMVFALGMVNSGGLAVSGIVHGLKVMAVAVVAQAVLGMAKSLCTERLRAGLAVGSAILVLIYPAAFSQMLAIVLGGFIGWRWLSPPHPLATEHRDLGGNRVIGALFLLVFVTLLIGLPVLAALSDIMAVQAVSGFYQAGSLVFGGGHVVLPLLEETVVPPGWVSKDLFVAGYAVAQAVPGPLFTFAAYLGSLMPMPLGGWVGGVVVLLAIFLPSFLLVGGVLPYWDGLRQRIGIQAAMGGINAAVVGLLAAALYDPVWTSAIHSKADFAGAMLAFGMLVIGKISPVWVVGMAALFGALLLTA